MFAICIETSHKKGMGHLFRMRVLADLLRREGLPFHFFLNAHAPSESILKDGGYPFDVVPLEDVPTGWQRDALGIGPFKVWIDDRLDTNEVHAEKIQEAGLKRVTFDDRGAGAALADVHFGCLAAFQGEPLQGKKVFTDLAFMILNPEIERYKRQRTQGEKLIVTLGGTDTFGVTVKVVEVLRQAGRGATVMVGPGFEHRAELQNALTPNFELKQSVPSLIEEFSHYDYAITGGGVTVFEALASGLPCVIVANEPHEVATARALSAMGVAVFAGHHTEMDASLVTRVPDVAPLSRAALDKIPAQGAENVLMEILKL